MAATADLVIRVVTDTAKAAGGLDNVGSSAGRMSAGIRKAALPAAAALAAVGAAAVAAGNAAADDAKAAAVLATTLKNTTGATDKQVASVESYIDATAKATGVSDDQLRPAMASLALATGDATKSQDLLATALDVSAVTGSDVESVSKALGKAYNGSTTSLKKLVPSLSDATLASGDMAAIMAELADKTGGSAAAAADTTAGKMARMQVSMDEAQEEIGSALLPALSALAGFLAKVAGFAQEHPQLFIAMAAAIGILAAGILILNVALSVMAIAEAVALGPILLIVAAVIALIVVVVLIVKHFDELKAAGVAVWNAIKTAAAAVWDALKSGAGAVVTFIVAAWNKIKDAVLSVFDWIKSNWPLILAVITGPIGLAVLAVVKNWDRIKEAARDVFEWLKTAWSNVVDNLKSAVSGLAAILVAPFDAIKSAVQWVIDKVESLIGALGRIHVPKIDLPGPLSVAAPAATGGTVAGFAAPGVRATPRATGGASTVVVNVTGAVDPEATARQIRRILAGHDRRIGLAT